MAATNYEIIHFSGRVQGVGFRYNVFQVSQEYDVTGFVRNLTDGRVRIEVEGGDQDIEDFVEAIHERMHGYVRQIERDRSRRESTFVGFGIR
ncbi:MAG: acylphosphatase [Candidatus Synoicihabitans palmerolidicus]|nr:acylphosphatase [Candidatus Synoicihabitans palmerolidicus]